MFANFAAESRALIKSIVELVYFMRGSISYDDMMHRTAVERQIFSEFIDSRLEQEKKKMNPIY